MNKNDNSSAFSKGKLQNDGTSINRRKFIGGVTTATLGLTVVPRHVLGGTNFIAPSDKITFAYIGTGTQGLRELPALIQIPEVQIVAVCDPQKEATGYFDWGRNSLRDSLRELIDNPNWNPGGNSTIPGGRDNAQEIVNAYYAKNRSTQKLKGCSSYADFRELFEKEKDLDAVKIMTPDHLHGLIAMAAIKRGKHVTVHKPLSNRLLEGIEVIDMSKKSKVTTHLIPWDSNGSMEQIMAWINDGVIGTLKEVHNWTNRPVWPQYPTLPTDQPPVPKGFDWDLWLGPEANRSYHPHYTNMVFRGWYDFGGGSMADMGHYSLWTVFKALQLEAPTIIEPNLSHFCGISDDKTAFRVKNDFSFPISSSVRFKYPEKGLRPAIDLIWYDGGYRPPVPEEFYETDKEFPAEGMMFIGDKGKIISEFMVANPYIVSSKMNQAKDLTKNTEEQAKPKESGVQTFVNACLKGKQTPGSFTEAKHITEAVNLYATALRVGKTLKYDAKELRITNLPDANKYLKREYRPGWEPESI